MAEEAANFFILTDNLDDFNEEQPEFAINPSLVEKMFETIEKLNLTPVSWCKIKFGFQGFEDVPLWDDIKDGIIMQIITERYEKYLNKVIKVKQQEDAIRSKAEAAFSFIQQSEETTERNVLQCMWCGTENSKDSKFCMACGEKFDNA